MYVIIEYKDKEEWKLFSTLSEHKDSIYDNGWKLELNGKTYYNRSVFVLNSDVCFDEVKRSKYNKGQIYEDTCSDVKAILDDVMKTRGTLDGITNEFAFDLSCIYDDLSSETMDEYTEKLKQYTTEYSNVELLKRLGIGDKESTLNSETYEMDMQDIQGVEWTAAGMYALGKEVLTLVENFREDFYSEFDIRIYILDYE